MITVNLGLGVNGAGTALRQLPAIVNGQFVKMAETAVSLSSAQLLQFSFMRLEGLPRIHVRSARRPRTRRDVYCSTVVTSVTFFFSSFFTAFLASRLSSSSYFFSFPSYFRQRRSMLSRSSVVPVRPQYNPQSLSSFLLTLF